MDPAELLKPINDRPIAAVCTSGGLSPDDWGKLVGWLKGQDRRVVLVGKTGPELSVEPDLDLRGYLAAVQTWELIFWCCLCVGPEGLVLDMARAKAVPVIVADGSTLQTIASRIKALWEEQTREARALADV